MTEEHFQVRDTTSTFKKKSFPPAEAQPHTSTTVVRDTASTLKKKSFPPAEAQPHTSTTVVRDTTSPFKKRCFPPAEAQPHTSTTVDFLVTSEDEDVLVTLEDEFSDRYEEALKANKALKLENARLRQRCSELERKLAKKDEETCRLYSAIRDVHACTSQILGGGSEASTPRPTPRPHAPQPSEALPPAAEDGKVNIGAGVLLEAGVWDWLKASKSDSRFCKDLAVAVWGSEVLRGRSTEGRVCNRLKTAGAVAKPPLTPNKYKAVKGWSKL
ncbi:BEN domain-containing protein 5-like [Alosa sapidissima]|uniref:BEN domain-containing protein 5-like n=1 Tax=Alosa sapidissima TaxID=34773 RepID=UPI001C087796|nr:BEN domain-containing protein 5-like [Alosa sapidissima]